MGRVRGGGWGRGRYENVLGHDGASAARDELVDAAHELLHLVRLRVGVGVGVGARVGVRVRVRARVGVRVRVSMSRSTV
jgi:hypothetical protein